MNAERPTEPKPNETKIDQRPPEQRPEPIDDSRDAQMKNVPSKGTVEEAPTPRETTAP